MATVQTILDGKGGEVVSIAPDSSVLQAAQLMNECGIGGLVVSKNDRLVGVFTERDILRRVVARQRDPADVAVRDVMTTPVACCRPETTLEEVRSVMTNKRIRHLPVVDDDGLRGIVTIGDIMAHQVTEQEDTIQYLTEYVYGTR